MSRYPKDMTDPMKQELIDQGVEDITTPTVVDTFFKKNPSHSAVLFINSVCGCSAGTARPAFIKSLKHHLIPNKIGTVFAGVDEEAVQRAREYIIGYPPSSPSIVFFRDGKPVYMLERKDIEGFDIDLLTESIIRSYNKFAGLKIDEDIVLKSPSELLEKSVWEVKKELDEGQITLLDCREQEERDISSISGSKLITQELADEMIKNWDHSQPLVFYCHYGVRSLQVALYFKQHGFKDCKSMAGGIKAWTQEIDKTMPTY